MIWEPGLGKDNILNFKPRKAENVVFLKKKGKFFLEVTRDSTIDKFCQKVFKVPPRTTLEIDDIGKTVWSFCDGDKTFRDVVNLMEAEFGSRIEPVIPRLLTFMKLLYQNRLITWDR